ncbi:para-nitrobenzyl esterase [Mycena albidolilacea]|uniref:Para-nitrobenzyl esterase n=1 Tax=Mycena albidolilacea TaxID=1033008 RepID=A0AAD7EN27_9AGAR|nr:para-nitrobenzyl esterase [Mycena albidolilacea]
MTILTYIVMVAEAILCARATSASPLQVVTDSGVLYGFVDPSAPAVRQFLGVPFALPPTGTHRWLPPAALTTSTFSINATSFSPSCPQIPLSVQALADVSSPKGGNQTEFFPIENFSEDCLTLNVWAPTHAEKLPVFVWFFGGGFQQGGTNSLYYNPTTWIQRTQAHIVVSVNFRSNIFGFPNAAGLSEQNLGLLDQRASLEWVRANIAAGTALFPSQITMTNDTAQANFAAVGGQLGCAVGAGQVDCLRDVAWQDIEALLVSNASIPKFLPIPDDRVVFTDYGARYTAGAFARIPAIVGTNEHELNALEPGEDALGNQTFLCTAAKTAQLRDAHGVATFRYRYDGNFTDISPPGFSGAYHASELPLLFGTAGKFHGPSTRYENVVGALLQDLWLDFARDPQGGLKRAGWGSFEAGKAVLLGDVDVPMKVMELKELDGVCAS